jgi:hypothetical protein
MLESCIAAEMSTLLVPLMLESCRAVDFARYTVFQGLKLLHDFGKRILFLDFS